MSASSKHNERVNQILDAGETLFATKGYDKTTVNDILKQVGIGKGTFYHYFASKEDVMDAVVMRVVGQFTKAAQAVADQPGIPAEEKLRQLLIGQAGGMQNKIALVNQLHHVQNAQLHQKSIVENILALTPIAAGIVQQGVDEGVFHTPYPLETIEMIFVANQFLFDKGIFNWTYDEVLKKVEALIYSFELLLGAKKGSFDYILTNFKEYSAP